MIEQDDEWAVAERRYFSAESMKLPTTPLLSTTTQEILAAIGYLRRPFERSGITTDFNGASVDFPFADLLARAGDPI
jgi:hypothetical protein